MSFFMVTMAAVSITAAKDLIRISPLAQLADAAFTPGSPLNVWEAVVVADNSLTDDQVAASLYIGTTLGTGTAATAASWDSASTFQGTASTDLTIDAAKGPTVAITTSSIANPSLITTGADHNFADGARVTISGHSGSTPSIDGPHIATLISPTSFTIPVNVTVGGTGGIVGLASGDAANPPLWRFSGTLPGGIVYSTDEPIHVLPHQHLVLRLETAPVGATNVTAYVLFDVDH